MSDRQLVTCEFETACPIIKCNSIILMRILSVCVCVFKFKTNLYFFYFRSIFYCNIYIYIYIYILMTYNTDVLTFIIILKCFIPFLQFSFTMREVTVLFTFTLTFFLHISTHSSERATYRFRWSGSRRINSFSDIFYTTPYVKLMISMRKRTI